MYKADQLRGLLCTGLHESLERLTEANVLARAFAGEPKSIPRGVLLRHNVEHVFRIRAFRRLDSAAICMLEADHPNVAQAWARYARSETIHDRYFLRDLAALGIDRPAVEALQTFSATRALVQFVGRSMQEYGVLPVVLYSFWAENNSDAGSDAVIARGRALFGVNGVRGAAAHRRLDEGQAHLELVSEVLTSLIRDPDDLFTAIALLECVTDFIGAYFGELEAWAANNTLDSRSDLIDAPSHLEPMPHGFRG